MFFSQRLKELRIEKGLTQDQLSAKTGLSHGCIAMLELEKRAPTASTISILADFFECSTDYLLGRSDDFGNVTVYQQTDGIDTLTSQEQKILDALRRNAPSNAGDFLAMYTELPSYMQESIFAELKGMHLGYKVSKNKTYKGELQ